MATREQLEAQAAKDRQDAQAAERAGDADSAKYYREKMRESRDAARKAKS
jgi:hypothetical protein